jgi:hypothetical protein
MELVIKADKINDAVRMNYATYDITHEEAIEFVRKHGNSEIAGFNTVVNCDCCPLYLWLSVFNRPEAVLMSEKKAKRFVEFWRGTGAIKFIGNFVEPEIEVRLRARRGTA